MLKKIVKKILPERYEPKKFWDNWAQDFIKDPWQVQIHPQHMWLLDIVKAEGPHSLLEAGCGFGRNIKFLIKNGVLPSKITGFDISPTMIKLAQEFVGNKEVKFFIADILNFETRKKFDLVFTHGVLMHIPEDQIGLAIDRLISLSKKTILFIEQNYSPRDGSNNYTFVHNYRDLLNSRGIDIIEYRSDKKLGLDLIYAKVR
jgi:spore coat polysaccharide biosynthesis protein SpsF